MLINIEHGGQRYINIEPDEAISRGISEEAVKAALLNNAWQLVREKRDRLLIATDYAIMPDYPLTDAQKAEVTAYRQALRDIPETYASPDAVEWPAKPVALA